MNRGSVKAGKKAKIERDMTRLAQKLSRRGAPNVGLKTRAVFYLMANMQKAGRGSSPTEREYWSERGWLGGERPWKQIQTR